MNNQQNQQDQKATLPTLDVKRAMANSTGMSKIAELREQERREFDARCDYLCKLPANTFAAIYAENEELLAGVRYNGEYYGEHEICYASLVRDEGYEQLI